MNTKYRNGCAFIALVIMLLPAISQAQVKFGVRAGLNASNISFKNLPDKRERFGYHFGVFVDAPVLSDFMSIQPELSYSTKGTAYKPLDQRQKLNMNYIDLFVPVAFHLSSIDIQAGAFASYLVSTPDYTVFEDNRLIIDAFKKFDAGLIIGLGYNFNNFLIGVRYYQGFVDVTKDSSRPVLGEGKNAVGQLSLGYRF